MEPKQPPITLWDELESLEDGNPPNGMSWKVRRMGILRVGFPLNSLARWRVSRPVVQFHWGPPAHI